MPGDVNKKLRRGEQIPHEAFNRFLDAADIALRNRVGARTGRGFAQTGIILVRNTTAGLVDQWGVLGLSAPIITPAENVDQFQSRVTFDGVAPNFAGRFCVLQEPLAAGEIGRAVISGVTVGKVFVTTAQIAAPPSGAEITAGNTTRLELTDSGTAEVLWVETLAAQGTAWALLRISNDLPPGGGGGADPDASATVRGYVSLTDQTMGDGRKIFQDSIKVFGTTVPNSPEPDLAAAILM